MAKKMLEVKNLGKDLGMPYKKVDFAKASQVSGNFNISFYQVDYAALVEILNDETSTTNEVPTIPITKIVMDWESFERVFSELSSLREVYLKNKDSQDDSK